MYLAVPSQPDCASAWREAVRRVDAAPGHAAYKVIVDIVDPIATSSRQDPRVAAVDDFLLARDKSVDTIANTIFPAGLYNRYGSPAFFDVFQNKFDVFQNKVLPKVRRSGRWSRCERRSGTGSIRRLGGFRGFGGGRDAGWTPEAGQDLG